MLLNNDNESKVNASRTHVPLLRYNFLHWLYDPLLVLSGLGSTFRMKVTELAHVTKEPQTILDVGCGTGTHLRLLATQFPNATVFGVDPDASLIERLMNDGSIRKSRVLPMHGFGDSLPYENESIDLCFSTLVFHHMDTESKVKAMREIFRVLRPGGTFLLTDWGESRVKFLRHLLLFEDQNLLEDHFRGLIPVYAHEAGFELAEMTRVKPTGIWAMRFVKPNRS